jgi:hypothetical protein
VLPRQIHYFLPGLLPFQYADDLLFTGIQ